MSGSAHFRSKPGEGSEFWVEIPLRIAAPPTSPAAPQLDPAALSGRVLLAEDNAVNRRLAEALLRRMGLEVAVAENGRQAVEKCRTGTFDVVLMDCQMPEVDGYEATAAIRRFPEPLCRIPIIALTAHAMAGDRDLCIAAGMNDYVSKPVSAGELAAALARHMSPVPV